jgi:hypothetical protein
MSNLSSGTRPAPYGQGGRIVNLPMSATAQVWEGAMVSELSGAVVTATTASAGDVQGIALHDALGGATDGATRVSVMYDQIFLLNASGTTPPTDATPFGTILYADTDNTVTTTAGSNPKAGRFAGMEDDGRVRVFINMAGQGAGSSITAALSNTAAVALGVAGTAGVDTAASRDDHVHPWAQKRTVALGHAMTGSADTNGTANTPINVGAVLPARAIVTAVEVVVTTSAGGDVSAKLDLGWSGSQDVLVDGLDLVASTPGSYDQNGGDKTNVLKYPVQAGGQQLTFTVTPDGGSKLSAMTLLVGAINVYFVVPF